MSEIFRATQDRELALCKKDRDRLQMDLIEAENKANSLRRALDISQSEVERAKIHEHQQDDAIKALESLLTMKEKEVESMKEANLLMNISTKTTQEKNNALQCEIGVVRAQNTQLQSEILQLRLEMKLAADVHERQITKLQEQNERYQDSYSKQRLSHRQSPSKSSPRSLQ